MPDKAAQYHCDKHVVKMILESAQLLSTAHRVLDGDSAHTLSDWREDLFYKATHVNHPCAIWVRQCQDNYFWLEALFMHLCWKYTERYGKVHLCEQKFGDEFTYPPDNLPDLPVLFEPPQCMPDYCKVEGDTVQAYRNYYNNEKAYFAVWKYSETPHWFNPKEKENV